MRFILLCFAFILPSPVFSAERSPKNIRLALYGTANDLQNGMTVSWELETKTKGDCPKEAYVRFGTDKDHLNGEAFSNEYVQYTVDAYVSNCVYHVTIPSEFLTPKTLYFYHCGSSLGRSEIMTFTTPVPVGSRDAMKIVLMGDLGTTENSLKTVKYIAEEESITCILLAGDLSYANGDQPVWQEWLSIVTCVISRVAMMVIAGNHEEERLTDATADKFVAYQSLFRMPSPLNSKDGNLYYSMRLGMVYLIAISPYIQSDKGSPQYVWLKKELASVDRTITPWLVVMTHAAFYQSNVFHQSRDSTEPQYEMQANVEDLLYEFGVNLVVCGHVHAHEVTQSVYKGEVVEGGLVYYTIGDGGNREGLAKDFMKPAPAWSYYREALYGYSVMTVTPEELKLDWYVHTDSDAPLLKKSVVITKDGINPSEK